MIVQDMATQEKQPKRRFSTWFTWSALALTLAITVALIVLVIWLFKTQNLTQFSTLISIIASIAALISAPLILFFTIVKWPEKEKKATIAPQPQLPSPMPPISPIPSPTDTEQPQTIFHIPYRQNPFFTGRELLLEQLHNNLTARKATALTQAQAINGLGGIGKTQVAIEYAYRHRDFYPYIFWVNADKRETLIADYVGIAKLLHLPEQNEQDQNIIVAAVIVWLTTHNDCLLILDNADDLHMIDSFLPTRNICHILITTRTQATNPIAQSIEVEKMAIPEGTLMLLRRASILAADAPLEQATQADKKAAENIVTALDGLPLALDQAGAYIEETACSLPAYLQAYQHRQADLLKRRGANSIYHSDSVATTWSLSFEQVEQRNPLAADLLRCCAFLASDDIPEEFFTEGANELSPLLQSIATDASLLDEAIGELRRFSLVRRNIANKTFSIHRLVQAIIRINMDHYDTKPFSIHRLVHSLFRTNRAAVTQKLWAERAVRIVNDVFPGGNIDVNDWVQCQRYLTHAQTCATFIEEYDLAFLEAAHLLNQTAYYLSSLALYAEAEPLFKCAIAIGEKTLSRDHPNLATRLNNVAELYRKLGKYEQAEPLYQQAITIDKKALGLDHPNLARDLNNLAFLYLSQRKYEQAEPLYQQALAIAENALGSDHPDLATHLNNLALLYYDQGKYEQAEPLYQRAIAIVEKTLGPDHPELAACLNNLAALYHNQGKYEQAEPLYRRALQIAEKRLGSNHPTTVIFRENYALFLANKPR